MDIASGELPSSDQPTDDASFLSGGGEMGALMRAHDWETSPLGKPDTWPQSLRAIVALMINSRYPMFVAWGPELAFLYNDGYAPIFGEKHPHMLGRPFRAAWTEIWDEISPLIDRALAGEATYNENLHLVMERNGYPEDTWYSFSYSPVRDESGAVAGIFCACTETTQQVLAASAMRESDARLRFLDVLAKAIQMESDPEAVMALSTRLLGEHLDVDICPYADVDADGDIFHIRRDWTSPGISSIVGTYSLDDFGLAAAQAQRRGVALVTRNAIDDLGEEQASAFTAIGIAATICVPLVKQGRLAAMMAVHSARPRDWTDDDVSLVTEVAERCWAHIERVGAQAVLLESEARLRDVLDNMGEGFVLLDRDFRIVHMNAEAVRLEERPLAEVLGKTHWEAHPDAAPELAGLYRTAMTERCAVALDHHYVWPDGRDTWLGMRAFPVGDGLAVFYSDISERKHAKAVLEESEERFRLIADSAPVPMWVSQLDRSRNFVNAAYLKFLGVPYEQAIAFDWREILHPDDHDRITAESIAGEASLRPFVLEGRYRRGDGDWRWLQSNSQPRFDADGSHSGFIGVAHDVTESRQAEAVLRNSEQRFREQFENANDFIFTTDLHMRITSCNPAVANALERSPDELIGNSISDYIPPETWEHNKAMLAAKLGGKSDTSRYEIEVFTRQGARMTWDINSRLIRDSSGTPLGLHAIGRDVTERIRNQQLLDEARLRAESDAAEQAAILGQLAEGVIITDGSGRITFVNEAATKLHGVAALDVEPSAYSETYHLTREDGSPYPSQELPLARAVMHGETVRDARWRICRPDGSVVLAIGNAQPIVGLDGASIGAVLTIRDDTARHAAEQALRELNETLEERVEQRTADLEMAQEALRQSQKLEAMGQLTGGVAHDFNNLLTPILGSLDLLQRRGIGDEREQRLIEGALQSAERAKLLVQRLLAFARRQPLKTVAVDVHELLGGMAELIASTCGPNIKMSVAVDEDVAPALADHNQLEMAILNLSVNARDAMPDGGRLTLAATSQLVGEHSKDQLAPGRYIRISVADTGTGMDQATIQRAIEPFFSTKGIGKGTGLGLSMVHGLASQLGGALTIASTPGLGTNVELWLPASETAVEVRGPVGNEQIPEAEAGTILLVDDEILVRASTADMLTDLGYAVIEADCAEDALAKFENNRFVMLVTDHLMPGMNGVDLVYALRNRQPDLPVLVVSGYSESGGIPPHLARLTKPFRQADLAAAITDVVRPDEPVK